jgi:2-C-methyl-D-erythritol 2,4-cyclodiphosphate synthase
MATTIKTGIGYDIHKLASGRALFLGGVKIDYPMGLLAHSDGDVVIHAVIDAILGACALGDIGGHFPDDDPKWKNADSSKLLKCVMTLVSDHGFRVEHLDVIIHAEKPKLRDWKPVIRHRLSELMKVSENTVNIKAKTNEGLDAVGRGEAIAAWAVATVSQ